MSSLLELRDVTKRFGGLTANEDVSFAVDAGQIVGLIGPNGAGKTTLFNCVAGYFAPTAGTIRLERPADRRPAARDAARAPASAAPSRSRAPSTSMTALENVMTGALLPERSVAQARERARRTGSRSRTSSASPTSRRAA